MDQLNYRSTGTGVPLVLLPGFCEDLSIWDAILPELSQQCNLITIDLPGIGGSDHLPAPTSVTRIAKQVHEFTQSLDIQEYIVAGHSLGGYISLELAKLYPESILGIGLIHSTAFADDNEKIKSRNKTIDFVRKRGVEAFIKSFVPQLFSNKESLNIEKVIDMAKQTPIESLVSYTVAMKNRQDYTTMLRNWAKPVMFVAGQNDTLIPIEKSRAHRDFIQEQNIIELPEIGHMGMYEAPLETIKALSALVWTISK